MAYQRPSGRGRLSFYVVLTHFWRNSGRK